MAKRDVIVSAFSTPPQAAIRSIAQPLGEFKDKPHLITLSGIGSETWMGPTDTARKPREPWGGTPFAREAAMYASRDPNRSVLRGLLASQAKGIDVRRIALVGFSAGGTFVGKVLSNPEDRQMVDAVIMLDALHIAKIPGGTFVPKSMEPWVEYGWRAAEAGALAQPHDQTTDPFLGPLFVTSHTNIKQDAAKEAIVGNTTDSSNVVLRALFERVTDKYDRARTVSFDRRALDTPTVPLPLTIGPGGATAAGEKLTGAGVPAPAKTWDAWPRAKFNGVGLFYDLDWGGTVAADHVFQPWFAQPAIWRAFLIPRWNATVQTPYTVSGLPLAGDWLRCCPGPGGNIVPPGFYPTGVPYWQLGLAGVLGFAAGALLLG